jgi:hypothetical protein
LALASLSWVGFFLEKLRIVLGRLDDRVCFLGFALNLVVSRRFGNDLDAAAMIKPVLSMRRAALAPGTVSIALPDP